MTYLVDTCGWIEWLTDGILINKYQPYLKDLKKIVVPTSIQLELYKWIKREFDETKALEIIALTEQAKVMPLSTGIALLAADLSLEYSLPFADAIIYATAQQQKIELVSSNTHFKRLNGVIYFKKII